MARCKNCMKCCRGLGWFLLLILLVWWVGLIAGVLHCLIAPCAACCECARKGTNLLMKGIRLPYLVTTFMIGGMTVKKAAVSSVMV